MKRSKFLFLGTFGEILQDRDHCTPQPARVHSVLVFVRWVLGYPNESEEEREEGFTHSFMIQGLEIDFGLLCVAKRIFTVVFFIPNSIQSTQSFFKSSLVLVTPSFLMTKISK